MAQAQEQKGSGERALIFSGCREWNEERAGILPHF